MGLPEEFRKKIQKQQATISELELQLREARAYMQALEDMAKLLPRHEEHSLGGEVNLREGSYVARARDALKKKGTPLHIGDLCRALGIEPDKGNRLSLSGSIASYVRKRQIFTRPAPNVFGLLEWSKSDEQIDFIPEKIEKAS